MKTISQKINSIDYSEADTKFEVPEDVFYYVAKIIAHVKFKHQILGVVDDRPLIKIKICYNSKSEFDNKAIDNIWNLIRDYQTIRYDGLDASYL